MNKNSGSNDRIESTHWRLVRHTSKTLQLTKRAPNTQRRQDLGKMITCEPLQVKDYSQFLQSNLAELTKSQTQRLLPSPQIPQIWNRNRMPLPPTFRLKFPPTPGPNFRTHTPPLYGLFSLSWGEFC